MENEGSLFEEKAVGISTSLWPKNAENKAEEEGEESKPDHSKNLPLSSIPFAVPGFHQHDHAAHNQSVDQHHKVGLQHELALAGTVNVGYATLLSFLDEGRATNVIPHLSRGHGKNEK